MAQMKYFYELTISSSPHVHSPVSTRTIMRDVLIALMPALLGSVYFFGLRALLVTLISVAGCVFFEWVWCALMKKPSKLYDMSAMVTGVLIAFVCPPTIPYWCVLIGDFFAIIIVKQLFGGIGRNIVNPALAARAFMFSWPVLMTSWIAPGSQNLFSTSDAVSSATPLAAMHQGAMPEASILDMFLGNIGGCIGETSVLLLLVGFAYLLIRKIISPRIPLAFLGTVAVLSLLFPRGNDPLTWCAAQLCTAIFGIGCGALTVLIRYFGGYPEGVSYAILVMNCCVVLLDRIGRPKRFGAPKKEAAK